MLKRDNIAKNITKPRSDWQIVIPPIGAGIIFAALYYGLGLPLWIAPIALIAVFITLSWMTNIIFERNGSSKAE